MQPPPVPSDDQAEQEEIYRLRAQKLKDKEKALLDEKEKLVIRNVANRLGFSKDFYEDTFIALRLYQV